MKEQITAIVNVEYWLLLQPMTGNSEGITPFGPFGTGGAARAFYEAEFVPLYLDEGPDLFGLTGFATKQYRKCFRKGGPLEWMNLLEPGEWEKPGPLQHGLHQVFTILEILSRQPA